MSDESDVSLDAGGLAGQPGDFGDFFRLKIAEAARRKKAAVNGRIPYRARLRFRLGQSLSVKKSVFSYSMSGRETEIRPASGNAPIEESDKLIWCATGFEEEADAIEFAGRLQLALVVVAARRKMGADVGYEARSTLQVAEEVNATATSNGVVFRTDRDGVMVYPDDGGVLIVGIEAALSVRHPPLPVAQEVADFIGKVSALTGTPLDALVLLNAALINSEPLARLALAVAAVEMLARDEKKWSENQKKALKALKVAATQLEGLSPLELEEVEAAAEGMKNFGVNESCRRLIRKLGLDDILGHWRGLYKARSEIFHGAAYPTKEQIAHASDLAINVCARIVLTAVAQLVSGAAEDLDQRYPLPSE